jgi:hypothetical protein
MICQFDVPTGKADMALDDAERELRELAEGLDIEEEITKAKWEDWMMRKIRTKMTWRAWLMRQPTFR